MGHRPTRRHRQGPAPRRAQGHLDRRALLSRIRENGRTHWGSLRLRDGPAVICLEVVPEEGIETGLDGSKNVVQSTAYEAAPAGVSSPNDGTRAPSRPVEADRVALLERAIERLTRAMGTVDDGDVADLVRERAAMRGELEGLTRDRNVVVLRPKPR